MSNSKKSVLKLVYAAVCLALALVLPLLIGQIPQIGQMLSPMHIPVLLCGFLCGWPYGLTGILYKALPKKIPSIYAALILAMIGGRIVWGAAMFVLAGLTGSEFPMSAFIAGAVTKAIPGIILHIVLVPAIVIALRKAKLVPNG